MREKVMRHIFEQTLYTLYRGCSELLKIHKNLNSNSNSKRGKTTNILNLDGSAKSQRIAKERNFSFLEGTQKCRLFQEFSSGKIWLYHEELFGLATNLLCIENGKDEFIKGLEQRGEYRTQEGKYKFEKFTTTTLPYIAKHYKKPMACEKYCRYHGECNHSENLISTVKLKWGEVKVLQHPPTISIEQGSQALTRAIQDAVNDPSKYSIHLLLADTGLGKTETYLSLDKLNVDVIAVPTHTLKNEIAKRYTEKGKSAYVVPELPDLGEYKGKYFSLQKLGAHGQAMQYLYSIKNRVSQLSSYLQAIEDISRQTDAVIITTHDRVLLDDTFRGKTVLFDEDPTPKLGMKGKIRISDLRLAKYNMKTIKAYSKSAQQKIDEISEYLEEVIGILEKVECQQGVELSIKEFPHIKKFKSLIAKIFLQDSLAKKMEGYDSITPNFFEFFTCYKFFKEHDGNTIQYISNHEFNFTKSIILSATAIPLFFEKPYGERVKVTSIPSITPKGRVIQYTDKSFSKFHLKTDQQAIDLARLVAGKLPVITHKSFENLFPENETYHFGAITGIDELKGRDICIVGTYRFGESSYFLDALRLGIPCELNEKMSYQKVEYKGKEFFFYTYCNQELRNLHISIIESELVQAVGRARIVREDCTVYVLSSFPIDGAEYRRLSEDYAEEMKDLEVKKENVSLDNFTPNRDIASF